MIGSNMTNEEFYAKYGQAYDDSTPQEYREKDARDKRAKDELLDQRIKESKHIMSRCVRAAMEVIQVQGPTDATAVALIACEMARRLSEQGQGELRNLRERKLHDLLIKTLRERGAI